MTITDGHYPLVEQGLRDWKKNHDISLVYVNDQSFKDTYYDNVHLSLFKRGLYLRIRQSLQSQESKMTFRAFTAIGMRVLQLNEVDEVLSAASLSKIEKKLLEILSASQPKNIVTVQELVLIGLRPNTEISVQRMGFEIMTGDHRLGSLSLDRVYFEVDPLRLQYQELEIKGNAESGTALESTMLFLMDEFPNSLKLTTLTKIERAMMNRKILSN